MSLYHRSAFGLPSIPLPTLVGLDITEHAKTRASERGVPLAALTSFDPSSYPVYQVETAPNGKGGESILKLNYRRRLNATHDYNVCLNPTERMVISCWVHDRAFRVSLDRAKYDRPRKVPGACAPNEVSPL